MKYLLVALACLLGLFSAVMSGYTDIQSVCTIVGLGGVGIVTIWPNKFRTRNKVGFDTMTLAGTTGVSTAIVDMSLSEHAAFIVGRHSGTAFTQGEILISENSDLSSPVVLKTKTGLALDGANDFCVLELRRDELTQQAAEDAGATQYASHKAYRYAGVRMTGTTGDICTVTAIGISDRQYEDLTPEITNN